MCENKQIIWVAEQEVLAIHEMSITRFGGLLGIRDKSLLQSALSRPQNLELYGAPSIFDLAAIYAHGIIKNHPFIDGNKRTAFITSTAFMEFNGYYVTASQEEAIVATLHLAESKMQAEQFAMWLGDNCEIKEA